MRIQAILVGRLQALSHHHILRQPGRKLLEMAHNRRQLAAHRRYRAALRGEPSTVIVTRQGTGRSSRVWLTFNGATRTTVVMTNPETVQLCELLTKGTAPVQRRPPAHLAVSPSEAMSSVPGRAETALDR